MLIAALLVIRKIWKQSTCPLPWEWEGYTVTQSNSYPLERRAKKWRGSKGAFIGSCMFSLYEREREREREHVQASKHGTMPAWG